LVIPKTQNGTNGNGTFRAEKFFFEYFSVARIKHGELQNTEHVPFHFIAIELKHGTERSSQCISMYKKKKS
jgi:hypothetical protein